MRKKSDLNNKMAIEFICGKFNPLSDWQKFCRKMVFKLKNDMEK